MLNKMWALAGLAGLVLLSGCGGKEETPSSPSSPSLPSAPTSAGTTADTVKDSSTEPVKEAKPVEGKEVTTPSGLKYVDVKVGTGASPAIGQMATVHYTGTLTDGKKFDSSYDHPGAEPFTFDVGGNVIKGWNEGIMTMKVGGKRKLIVPADLAYGHEGRPGIPPDATLLFDIELLSIK